MKKSLLLLCFSILLFTQSCKDSLINVASQQEPSTIDVHSIDGILAFKDFNSLTHFCKTNENLSGNERAVLESKYQYTSILSTYNNKLEENGSETPLYYTGSPGLYLNKDRMVIIQNNLYLFNDSEIRYASLKTLTVTQARSLLLDRSATISNEVHINKLEDSPLATKDKNARVGNYYIVQSNIYTYGNGSRSYSTASLRSQYTFMADGTRACFVTLRLVAYITFNDKTIVSYCNDVIHQANGSFNLYKPAQYGGPNSGQLYGPYPFSVNVGPHTGGGSVDFMVATITVPNDTDSDRAETYFEGTGSFSTSHGTCLTGFPIVTTGSLNL